MSHLISKN